MLKNELIKCLLDTFHIQIVFLEALGCQIFKLRAIERLVDSNQVILNSCEGSTILHFKTNEFVWNNAHFLEAQCLHLSSRKALDDPTLVVGLTVLDLFLNKLSDDVIGH